MTAECRGPAVERGIDICRETVRLWWDRFGPLFAGEIRRRRASRLRAFKRETYKERRSAALAEWRAVMG